MGNSIREDDTTCTSFMWQTWLYRANQRVQVTATIINKGTDFRAPEKVSEKGGLKNPDDRHRRGDIETACIHLHVYQSAFYLCFK